MMADLKILFGMSEVYLVQQDHICLKIQHFVADGSNFISIFVYKFLQGVGTK